MLDVAEEADTDADTDCRYAGAIPVSGVAVPLVTVVHPTMPISATATQPAASPPRLGNSPPCVRGIARPPMSTAADVTGSAIPRASTHRVRVGVEAEDETLRYPIGCRYPRGPPVRHDGGEHACRKPTDSRSGS